MKALLSTTYFGPIQWYQKLYRSEEVQIEQWESFQKQTYRNRCLIATTQGIQALTVPVERNSQLSARRNVACYQRNARTLNSQLIKDVRISDHGNWRHLHWNALVSAYGESPFFEYYQDEIRPFFENRWNYLLDFNEAIREKMCELLDIQPKVVPTPCPSQGEGRLDTPNAESVPEGNQPPLPLGGVGGGYDFRSVIRPKHPIEDPDFEPKPYYQVYQQKHGFLPNLSVLDLLFNMGPEGIFYL